MSPALKMDGGFRRTRKSHSGGPAEQPRCLSILVVENHLDTLVCLSLYLETLGHAVTSVRTMTDAVASWPLTHREMLISDLRLPDGDGWELLGQLHCDPPTYALAISGLGMAADRVRSEVAGYHRHLTKPFRLAELDAALLEAAQAASDRMTE